MSVPPFVRRHGFAAALVAVFAAFCVQHAIKVSKPSKLDTYTRSAVARWKPQIEAMDQGIDIWEKHEYPNPPVMAIILRPVVALDPVPASVVWFCIKAALACLSLVWIFHIIEAGGRPFPVWAKALAVALAARPILGDLSHGNVNLLILFLVVAALRLFHAGRDLGAGVVVGLATACKVTPALFLPYFVWKRAWAAAAGVVAGLALFLFVVPGLYLGQARNVECLGSWAKAMVAPFAAGKVTSEHANQSLPGVLYRLLGENPSFSDFEKGEDGSDKKVGTEYHNVAALPNPQIALLAKACVGAFALLGAFACRTPTRPRHDWRIAAECGLVVTGMLLFSERTWKHHAVTLALPIAVLCYVVALPGLARASRRAAGAALGLTAAVFALTSEAVVGERGADLAQVYGAYTAVFVALAGASAVVLVSERRAEAGTVAGTDARPAAGAVAA